jgi:hypothetical protein
MDAVREVHVDREAMAAEWLTAQVAAGRIPPEPTPDEIALVVRIVGPALRRMAVPRREPAA